MYWLSEFGLDLKYMNELRKENKKSVEGFNKTGSYNSKTELKTDLNAVKAKIGYKSVCSSLFVAGLYLSDEILSNSESLQEVADHVKIIIENIEIPTFTAAALFVSSAGAYMYKNYSGNFKDSSALSSSLEKKAKLDIIKDFFNDDGIISTLDDDEILSLGSCYSHLKKNSLEKRNISPPLLYKYYHVACDKIPFLKSIKRKQFHLNKTNLQESNFHKKLINYVDNIDSLIPDRVVDTLKEHQQRISGKTTSFSIGKDIYDILEKSFDDVYAEKKDYDIKMNIIRIIDKSIENPDFFKKNEKKIDDYIKIHKKSGIINNKDSFYNNIDIYLSKLKDKGVVNKVLEKEIEKYKKNPIKFDLDRVSNKFKEKLLTKCIELEAGFKASNEFVNTKEEYFKKERNIVRDGLKKLPSEIPNKTTLNIEAKRKNKRGI